MLKPIISFLCGKISSLTAYIEDFTNQAKCECKVIYEIRMIALVFMCCNWSVNRVKKFLNLTWTLIYLSFLWYTMEETVTLPEDKNTLVEA